MIKSLSKFMVMISLSFSVTSSFTITSGPQDTTMCMYAMAPCDCGFTGASPYSAIPDWNITFRSDTGSVISNGIIEGEDISLLHINGLRWLPDTRSGILNATNSQLLVGPINMTHDRSSYQCMFTILREGSFNTVMSSVGTMTVLDLPSVTINVDEICTTSIIISLNTTSNLACGDVSHYVTISDNVVNPDGDSKYFIDGLESDTLHNIIVTSTYKYNGSRIFNQSVRTSSPKSPNPINTTSIIIEKATRNGLRITWKPAKFDRCSMLAIKHYEVMVYSDEAEIKAEAIPFEQNDYLATFPQNLFDDYSSITITVNITVVNIIGQRSTTSSVTVNINDTELQITSSNPADSEEESNIEPDAKTNDNNPILITIPIVAAVLIILSIFIIISILYLRCRRKNNDKELRINTEENCYETQDECKSQDLASPYAVSGPTSAWSDSTESNKNEVTSVHEPSTHADHTDDTVHDKNIDEDESTPPLPPRLNYAEILLDNQIPKFINADNHVTYVETKPT